MPIQYNLNGMRLGSYPPGMENLISGEDYQPRKYWRSGWHCTVVKASNVTIPYLTYFSVKEEEIESFTLFKGYDDIDYSSLYYIDRFGYLNINEPGCYVMKLRSQDRKILWQTCRLDIPYDIGASYKDFLKAKVGDEFNLSEWKFSYFYYEDYFWDTRYDYIDSDNVGGRVSLRRDYSNVAISADDSVTVQYDDKGNGIILSGDNGDGFYSGITIPVVYRDRDYTVSYNDSFQCITDWRVVSTNDISHIQRVGGSQMFCYLEDGTVIPFQRSGKNIYGYGSMQLSGVDYGSYMEVSVDGGDSVVMDYWQRRGIYVPRGGDDG